MFDKFLLPLAISVNGVDSRTQEMIDAAAKEKKDTIIWIIVLVAIIATCFFFNFILPKIKGKSATKKAVRAEKKAEKERDAELERLHEIKRKNQRK